MQATSIIMPAANIVDPAGEGASTGQGIRVNSALELKEGKSLFTAILQKGFTLNPAGGLLTGDAANQVNPDDTDKKEDSDQTDVCSLLMQLMVMNASGLPQQTGDIQGGTDADGTAISGVGDISDIIAGLSGLDATSAADLMKLVTDPGAAPLEGDAAPAAGILAGNDGQAQGAPDGTTHNGTVISGIVEALRNNLTQAPSEQPQPEAVQQAPDAAAAATAAVLSDNGGTDAGALNAARQTGLSAFDEGTSPAAEQTAAQGSDAVQDALNIKATGTAAGSDSKDGSGLDLGTRDKSKPEEMNATGVAAHQPAVAPLSGETMAEKTAAVEKALNRFAEDIVNVSGGTQEIKIILEPESLGTLTISVSKTETGVTAKIKSEDKELVAAISDQLQKLISSMESKGVRVTNVDVVYSQTEQNTGFGQQNFDRGRDDGPKSFIMSFGRHQETDATGTDFWQGFYGSGTDGDTQVDYRI